MRKRGYDLHMSAGAILGGASLDPIIPPSVLAIIIATLAEVSTGKMLIAGVIPGLLLSGMFIVYVLMRVYLNPALAPDVGAEIREPATRGSALMAFVRMLPAGFIFFLVMGVIMLGVATPTEVAWFYGGLTWKMLTDAFYSAVTVATLLLLIMSCATMFSQLLAFTGATQELGDFVVGLRLSGAVMLLIMMAVPFVLFMFLDQVALMMVLIPIYQPLLKVYGFDPIWFWTLFLIIATVGSISPPFGYTMFALKSAAPDVPMTDIYRAAWPYVWIILFGMLIMAMFPSIITFLPERMASR
jgi:tripartite ATP-independent transporter DctM subunit